MMDLKKNDSSHCTEIPQFFIVETHFVEQDKLSINNLGFNGIKVSNFLYSVKNPKSGKGIQNEEATIIDNTISTSEFIQMYENQNDLNFNDTTEIVILSDDEGSFENEEISLNSSTKINRASSKSENPNKSVESRGVGPLHLTQNVVLNSESSIGENIDLTKAGYQDLQQPASSRKSTQEIEIFEVISEKEYRNVGVQVIVEKIEKSISTLPPMPTRSRSVQSKLITLDKSVQCDIIKSDSENLRKNSSGDENDPKKSLNKNPKKKTNHKTIEIYSNGKYECLICGEISGSLDYIKSHVELHKGKQTLCQLCGQTFKNKYRLKLHKIKNKCLSYDKEIKNFKIQRIKQLKVRFCPYPACGYVNCTSITMCDHMKYHLYEKLYICLCGCNFTSYKRLNRHRRLKRCRRRLYKFLNPSGNNRRKSLCRYCYKICKNSFDLMNHMRRVHLRKWKCLLCNQLVDTKIINRHIIDHRNSVGALHYL